MPKTIIETVNSRIDELLAARDAEIEAARQKLTVARSALADAQTKAENAISSADVDAYAAAKEEEIKAGHAVELYTARLDQLENKAFVDSAEDVRILSQLQKYQKDLQDAATAEIIALLSRIEEIGHKYYRDQDVAANTFDRWYSQMSAQYGYDKIDDSELRSAIMGLATNWFYRKELDIDQYHGTGSFWTN